MDKNIKFRCWYDHKMHKVTQIDFAYEKIHLFAADIINFGEGILMQYTGLKDKNGKEIYEGDAWEEDDGYCVVVYDEERACFCVDIYGFTEWIGEGGQECYGSEIERLDREILYFYGDISKIEITKNIYENPELEAD